MYYIKVSDGVKLVVEDYNRSSKNVIVMVHGWPLNQKMFEYQRNMLIDLGFRVVSFDIRGFGKSDASSHDYSYDRMATDLWCVIDNLKVEHVTLLGFSMGGAVCARYLSLFDNERVEKLILAGAALPSFVRNNDNPYGMKAEDFDHTIGEIYHDRAEMVKEFSTQVFARNHSDAFQNWFQSLGLDASSLGTIGAAISLREENLAEDLKKISVPTFILHGKIDRICSFEMANLTAKIIPGATLIPFDYSGHGLFYDELEKFNQTLEDILTKK